METNIFQRDGESFYDFATCIYGHVMELWQHDHFLAALHSLDENDPASRCAVKA